MQDNGGKRESAAGPLQCTQCGAALEAGRGYTLGRDTLCDACAMEARATRPRKTHWQYLGAIKSQYLQDAEEE